MRSIVLPDAITGESLHIEFDLDRNQMRIDGSKVVREAPVPVLVAGEKMSERLEPVAG